MEPKFWFYAFDPPDLLNMPLVSIVLQSHHRLQSNLAGVLFLQLLKPEILQPQQYLRVAPRKPESVTNGLRNG